MSGSQQALLGAAVSSVGGAAVDIRTETISYSIAGSVAYAGWKVWGDGTLEFREGNTYVYERDWCLVGDPAADYQFRITTLTGAPAKTGSSDLVNGNWAVLSTNYFQMQIVQFSAGSVTATVRVEVRRSSDLVTIANEVVTLFAERT